MAQVTLGHPKDVKKKERSIMVETIQIYINRGSPYMMEHGHQMRLETCIAQNRDSFTFFLVNISIRLSAEPQQAIKRWSM